MPFHILDRGNNRQTIFRQEGDFIYFLRLLKKYKKELEYKIYHFCLMPNHIHLMIEPTIDRSLSGIMMRLTLAYSSYFNKKYRGVGHVWQGRYKSSLIDKEDYFICCGVYIDLNPVRAQLVERPEDWQWSSYRLYAFGETNPLIEGLIDVDSYYLQLAVTAEERRKKYRENFSAIVKEEAFLKNIREKLDEGIFGKPGFIQEMKEKFKIKSLRPRGRPRRGKEIKKEK